jgi:hypothetical protein
MTVRENPLAASVAQLYRNHEERNMADLRIDEASQAALKARLASPEGRAALDELARIIAGAFVRSLPEGTDLGLVASEGREAFRAAWPDIVDAFLHRRGLQGAGRKSVRTVKAAAEKVVPKLKD